MVLGRDEKAKEERMKRMRENRGDNGLVLWNVPLKRGKEMLEIFIF